MCVLRILCIISGLVLLIIFIVVVVVLDRIGFGIGLIGYTWRFVIVIVVVVCQGKYWLMGRSRSCIGTRMSFWVFLGQTRRQLV